MKMENKLTIWKQNYYKVSSNSILFYWFFNVSKADKHELNEGKDNDQ